MKSLYFEVKRGIPIESRKENLMELQKRIVNLMMWAIVLVTLSVCAVHMQAAVGVLHWLLMIAVGSACVGFAEAIRGTKGVEL